MKSVHNSDAGHETEMPEASVAQSVPAGAGPIRTARTVDESARGSTHAIAQGYAKRGWAVVPIPFKQKKCVLDKWQDQDFNDRLDDFFADTPMNIGINPGRSGLADVDLDCREARELGPAFLPSTGAVFGRKTAPMSHWIYELPSPQGLPNSSRVTFIDPTDKVMLCELRYGCGVQTVFPGSVHQDTGEMIEWHGGGAQTLRVDGADLHKRVAGLAAMALLFKHWPHKGSRHEAALAFGGIASRSGMKRDVARKLLERFCEGDEEFKDRLRAFNDAFDREGDAPGATKLADAFGGPIAKAVVDWLGLDQNSRAREEELATLFADRHADELRFVESWGWMHFDGQRWCRQRTGLAPPLRT
jgi:hypothetical protein